MRLKRNKTSAASFQSANNRPPKNSNEQHKKRTKPDRADWLTARMELCCGRIIFLLKSRTKRSIARVAAHNLRNIRDENLESQKKDPLHDRTRNPASVVVRFSFESSPNNVSHGHFTLQGVPSARATLLRQPTQSGAPEDDGRARRERRGLRADILSLFVGGMLWHGSQWNYYVGEETQNEDGLGSVTSSFPKAMRLFFPWLLSRYIHCGSTSR